MATASATDVTDVARAHYNQQIESNQIVYHSSIVRTLWIDFKLRPQGQSDYRYSDPIQYPYISVMDISWYRLLSVMNHTILLRCPNGMTKGSSRECCQKPTGLTKL
jgi:hypothetical protein